MGSPPERRLTAPFCTRICPVERGDGFSSRTPPQAAFCTRIFLSKGDGFSSRTAPYGAVLYSHMSCGKRRWVLLQNAAAGGVLYSHIPVERRWVLLQNGALRRRSVLAELKPS